MSRNRSFLALLLCLFLVLLPAIAGAETAAPAAKQPEVKLEAPAKAKGLRVAVLPLVNATGEMDADKIMEDVLRERVKDVDPSRAGFLMPADVERVLDDANAYDRALKVTDRWSKYGSLDSTSVAALDSVL